ncbi:MAG: thermonuclease family protein [Candidatus Uhrbacteria bacterium]|nr:thermonuclease family protein [Candidatus Uhrbacteria bacterium]
MHERRNGLIGFVVVVMLVILWFIDPTIVEMIDEVTETYRTDGAVIRVVDGDTVVVAQGDDDVTVRIIGINTPETVDPRRAVECFGQEASDAAKTLLEGQVVTLVSDATQGDVDKYDRLLRYVELVDGTDVGLHLISQGYGYEYTYNTPYARQSLYNDAEDAARLAEIGLWAEDACD